ncbi:UvrB/UvrC motif-containing protein [Alkalihalobacillus hemicellulosilyticus]|uniref:Nucleotide excision repair protein n=1 Tax=Halalkalibacter hemicellulosilyticusJCM 9152 TaxID=1236971 RepID=W4QIJ6_9BACI|nr:UvrB/UvrC motif-containing protein [Halalkalibacter hemicellulosilyticus]GAE31453.1 nucleotide excision repair protein [Halalkalibacter hemicellulosilyticusJCM 9152]
MLCQECNQREATLHFAKIINGEKTEFHICEKCAKEKGEYSPGSNSFSIHQLLSGLLHFEQPVQSDNGQTKAHEDLKCSKCGMTYVQFTKVGRFGCDHCYKSFSSKLDPILKRVHSGNHTHAGKIPKRIGGGIQIQRKIDGLKQELRGYIDDEAFEKAAEIRDQIRALEKEKNEQKGG